MPQEPVEGRVTRLEESALFADRAVDALDEAVREMAGAIDRLARRVESLESRLEELASGEPDPRMSSSDHPASR